MGVFILFVMIGTAFMGYVLPWGQMSFWAATVITNLVSVIPFYGFLIVVWFWGGFSVDVPTLNRFFALHYLMPFVLTGLIILHLFFLHEAKSGEPLGLSSISLDGIPFGFYYIIKDIYGFVYYFLILCILVFYYPNLLGHSDNYILANPVVTPAHIVPEWYFLPLMPLVLNQRKELSFVPLSGFFRPFYEKVIQIFLFSCIILGWIGGNPVVYPYVWIGVFFTVVYFVSITYGVNLAMDLEFISSNEIFLVENEKINEFDYYKGRSAWDMLSKQNKLQKK